jgi:hypothetical protein
MKSEIDIYKTGTPSDKGEFGYYNLTDWWDKNFTSDEKNYILEKYIPMGGVELTKGSIHCSSTTVISFLTGLQSWFTTLADEAISEKILKKAELCLTDETPIIDKHFLYGCLIEHYYKKRNINSEFYDLAKQYCLKQIAISKQVQKAFHSEIPFSTLPRHKGYEQLAIILEKEKDYDSAMLICLEAKDTGWNTDWDKRILTLEKKQRKHGKY